MLRPRTTVLQPTPSFVCTICSLTTVVSSCVCLNTGDASESGLIKAVQLLEDVKKYRARYPKLFEIKFNSTNKYQIGIHDQTVDGDNRPLLVMKVCVGGRGAGKRMLGGGGGAEEREKLRRMARWLHVCLPPAPSPFR